MMHEALVPGVALPAVSLATLDGGTVDLGAPGWTAIVVYRGAHCPICKAHLKRLEGVRADYEQAGVRLVAVSADEAERAAPFIDETGFRGTVGVGLSLDDMAALGLYVSDPRSPEEAPAPFAEPALIVVNPGGKLQIVEIANAPFVRPDMGAVLDGLKFVQAKDYPIRGTHAA